MLRPFRSLALTLMASVIAATLGAEPVPPIVMKGPPGAPRLALAYEADGDGSWARFVGALREGAPIPATLYVLRGGPEALPGDDVTGDVSADSPGEPFLRGPGLPGLLVDEGVVALLSIGAGEPGVARIAAAARGYASPRHVLKAARAAAASLGLTAAESPVPDFYAVVGLADGEPGLLPWLEAGLPALAVRAPDPAAFAEAFASVAALASGAGSDPKRDAVSPDGDVGYLRYPLPGRIVTLGDRAIVVLALGLGSFFFAVSALGLLRGRRRSTSFAQVAREGLTAFAMAFVALALTSALIALGRHLSAAAFGSPPRPGSAWLDSATLALRAFIVVAAFYAASGIAAKAGLHGEHGRIEAARAALLWFCSLAVACLPFFPQAAPFLLAGALLSTLTSLGPPVGLGGLALFGALVVPFLDIQALSSLRTGSATALEALGSSALLAVFATPFGLWIVTAFSRESALFRGRRTWGFWLASALLASAGEALLPYLGRVA